MAPELQNTRYFTSDPEWTAFASHMNLAPLRTESEPPPQSLPPLDTTANRAAQAASESAWAEAHPLSSIAYVSFLESIPARDNTAIEVKCYRSDRVPGDTRLPLLFVTHAGGFVQGTYVTEEAWLLWPLLRDLDLCVISVKYRLAPEASWDTIFGDCWDVLQHVMDGKGREGRFAGLNFDEKKVILAGSSSGACLSALLAQKVEARNAAASHTGVHVSPFSIKGILLNVPITCDPRHFPTDQFEYTSYEQCFGTLLNSRLMRLVWNTVVPDPEAGKAASPLLGEVIGLPEHVVYVAGQDPLRDEGIAYARKLESAGVKVTLRIYQGVPHTFGEFWELGVTRKWWKDLKMDCEKLMA